MWNANMIEAYKVLRVQNQSWKLTLEILYEKFREGWYSNPGLLGEKREHYLCAMQPHSRPSPKRHKLSWIQIVQEQGSPLECTSEASLEIQRCYWCSCCRCCFPWRPRVAGVASVAADQGCQMLDRILLRILLGVGRAKVERAGVDTEAGKWIDYLAAES